MMAVGDYPVFRSLESKYKPLVQRNSKIKRNRSRTIKGGSSLSYRKNGRRSSLLSYYQLMNFRHELMLEYLFPAEKKLTNLIYPREIEGQGRKVRLARILFFLFHRNVSFFSRKIHKGNQGISEQQKKVDESFR